ncbi:MAG: YfaZ family outer membrane protein [Gammaproteobacteria bacterium]
MLNRILVALCFLGCVSVASAQSLLDINLSDDTGEFRYIIPFQNQESFGSTEFDLGILYTTNDDVLGIFGFQVVDEAGTGSPGLELGIGVKGFMSSLDRGDLLAATLGINVNYSPPALPRAAVSGYAFFSPDIVTFLDAKRFLYTGARISYEVLPQASVYLGYRKARVDMGKGADIDVDNGGHLGIKVYF